MDVSKNQIINGLVKFAKKEMLPKITDRSFRTVLHMGIGAIDLDHSIADGFFKNKMFQALMREENGLYDLDFLEDIFEEAIEETGEFMLTIPAIPIIAPHEKMFSFNIMDFKKLKSYIQEDKG